MSDPTALHLLYTDYNKLTNSFTNQQEYQVPQQVPYQVPYQVPQQFPQQVPYQVPQQVFVHLVCVDGKPFIFYEDEPSRLYPAFISKDSLYGEPRTL